MALAEDEKNVVTGADLLRRGATLLQEACPRCGGVQIKYQGKVYCLNEDDLGAVLNPNSQVSEKKENPPPANEAENSLRKMLEDKLANASKQLESTSDIEEQARLLDLISKYLETIKKLGTSKETV